MFADNCFYVGFIGDFLLQMITKIRGNIANLKPYFNRHGSLEAMFIAGGMMYLFGHIYTTVIGPAEPDLNVINLLKLFIYGGVLDIIWRQFNLFPSLKHTYYTANNQLQSFIWGGIPMIIPLFIGSAF